MNIKIETRREWTPEEAPFHVVKEARLERRELFLVKQYHGYWAQDGSFYYTGHMLILADGESSHADLPGLADLISAAVESDFDGDNGQWEDVEFDVESNFLWKINSLGRAIIEDMRSTA